MAVVAPTLGTYLAPGACPVCEKPTPSPRQRAATSLYGLPDLYPNHPYCSDLCANAAAEIDRDCIKAPR